MPAAVSQHTYKNTQKYSSYIHSNSRACVFVCAYFLRICVSRTVAQSLRNLAQRNLLFVFVLSCLVPSVFGVGRFLLSSCSGALQQYTKTNNLTHHTMRPPNVLKVQHLMTSNTGPYNIRRRSSSLLSTSVTMMLAAFVIALTILCRPVMSWGKRKTCVYRVPPRCVRVCTSYYLCKCFSRRINW